MPDTTPPTLQSIAVINATTLDVNFSEPLDSNTATLAANYVLSNSYGTPAKVSSTALKNVYRLTFSKAFGSGDYRLNISNIKDLKGNLIQANSSLEFTYIQPYVAKFGDLVINESLPIRVEAPHSLKRSLLRFGIPQMNIF